MSDAEARIKTIEHVKKTQQSKDYTESTAFALSQSPIHRLFSMFTQTPMQYLNRVYQQLNTIGTERFDPKAFASMYMVYMVLMPQLFSYVSKAFRPPDRDDLIAQSLIGPASGIPLFGEILEWSVINAVQRIDRKLTGKKIKNRPFKASDGIDLLSGYYSNVEKVQNALLDIMDNGNLSVEDFFSLTKALADMTTPVTGSVGGAARVVLGGAEGIYRGSEEGFVKNWRRWLMLFGYSEYQTRADKKGRRGRR
jgi:hypothetical protein